MGENILKFFEKEGTKDGSLPTDCGKLAVLYTSVAVWTANFFEHHSSNIHILQHSFLSLYVKNPKFVLYNMVRNLPFAYK